MSRFEWELDADDDRDPCPMGCGNLTDDVAGGPCSGCWDDAPIRTEYDDSFSCPHCTPMFFCERHDRDRSER